MKTLNPALPLWFLVAGLHVLSAQVPVTVMLDGIDTKKILQTRSHSRALTGTVIAPGGLATMYTLDEQGNRGQVTFTLVDDGSGSYVFKAGPIPLRAGQNRIAVVAADESNAGTSATLLVLSDREAPPRPEIRTGKWKGRQLSVRIQDGLVYYDGDMILGTVADFDREQGLTSKDQERAGFTTGFTSSLWPKASGVVRVPYQVTSSSSNMTSAISSFNATFAGQIQWVTRTSETDYVNISLNSGDHSFSCAATVGRAGGAQTLNGSIDCLTSTLLHEMGHAMGLYHEHQRPDYPSFVNYFPANIDAPIQPGNFGFVGDNAQAVGLYDYGSIMHYGAFTFSKNNLPVMETIPAGMPIGEASGYSAGDLDQLKRLYGFTPTQVTITTSPPGLPIIVDTVAMTSPQTFAWAIGQVHSIGVPAGFQTASPADGAQYSFGNWNDSGAQSHSITVTAGSGTTVAPASSPAVTVYVASYQRYNPITTLTLGSGAIGLSPLPTNISGNNFYLTRTAVTATATPNAGNVFLRWFGNDPFPGGQNPKSYIIQFNPYTIEAQFTATAPIYTVSATFTNNTPPNPAVGAFFDGNFVTLPAILSAGDGWTPASNHTLTVTSPQSPVTTNIAYNFSTWNFGGSPTTTAQNITLPGTSNTYTATFIPSYRGYSITSPFCATNPATPLVTDQLYSYGALVNFQVNPISLWSFAGFSGSLTGTTNPQSLTVHDQFIVTANLNTVATPLTVTGYTPSKLAQGASTQFVTINGTGFTNSTIVFVNGTFNSGRPMSFIDSQHIQVQLGPTDLTTPGGFPIGVQNSANSCSIYMESTFLVNSPASGTPTSMTANAGSSGQTATINTAFGNPLAVTVRDAGNNPVSGVSVTFTAPGTGASGTFSNSLAAITVSTNPPGVASVVFTANATVGANYTVTTTSGSLAAVNFTLSNTPASQTITFPQPADTPLNGGPVTMTATASSGLAVSYSSLTTSICTVSGSSVTLAAIGACTIHATQAGNASFAAATPVDRTFNVTPGTQSITFPQPADTALSAGPVTLNATATSGLPVSYSSLTTSICTVSGSLVTLVAAGACTIHATQSGNGIFAAATPVDRTFNAITVPRPGLQFVPLAPCRIMDTRGNGFTGSFGPPSLAASETRNVPVPSSSCGIPSQAQAYALNVTVIPKAGTLGYLTVWPTGQAQPGVSTLNAPDGSILANAAIVPAGTGGSVSVFALNSTDLVVDINGYFIPPGNGTLQFYPLAPCRVLDTRNANGAFGGPAIAGGTSRSFPISTSTCGIPASAAAYSFNATAVPQGFLGYLTAWPAGQQQPPVSTLNSLDGTVLANSAIVPAGANGAVSFFASNTTHLVVDINGYFAAPASGGLNFFTSSPCRVVDTRNVNGPLGGPVLSGNTSRSFPLPASACGQLGTASAYSINVTVQPPGPLGYLTIWPSGQSQPLVSTLNAPKGLVVANAAIVPAGLNGSLDVYSLNTSHVIIDINGYFGQ